MNDVWTEAELMAATNGGFSRGGFAASAIRTDSRHIKAGEAFVALVGVRDGHDFVRNAMQRGASGAIVSRDVAAGHGRLLLVDDTLDALTRLGELGRMRSRARFCAITGSVGKSTTKEMVRRVLAHFGLTHAAEASFNNHIGVPLTLANLPREAAFGVVEIGMNHPGEIAPLARLTRPHVGVITQIGSAHIGMLGSIHAIADEKAQLLASIEPTGTAILPSGPLLPRLARRVPDGARIIGFGADALAEARLLAADSDAEGVTVKASILRRQVQFRLAAPGTHMAMNAVAALAAAGAFGLDVMEAATLLNGFAPLAGRGARRKVTVNGRTILLLDESYNASGPSMRAALNVLAVLPGRKIVVLGDMLELGDYTHEEHRALAEPISAVADLAFACGAAMRSMFDELPTAIRGGFTPDSASLAPIVKRALRDGDAVLVKGSNGSAMRVVIDAFEEKS